MFQFITYFTVNFAWALPPVGDHMSIPWTPTACEANIGREPAVVRVVYDQVIEDMFRLGSFSARLQALNPVVEGINVVLLEKINAHITGTRAGEDLDSVWIEMKRELEAGRTDMHPAVVAALVDILN